MATILYITSDNIRAALGLSEKELSDAQILNVQIVSELTIALDDVYPDHVALNAANAGTPTADETKLYMVLQLYLQWQGAVCMLPALQLLAEQKVSDTSFEKQRFMKDDLQQTIDRITGQRDKYASILQVAANIESPSASPFAHMSAAVPGYDPVTNGG